MYKTKRILFLCIPLLLTTQAIAIAVVSPPLRSYLGSMNDYTKAATEGTILDASSMQDNLSVQDNPLLAFTTYGSFVKLSVGAIGQPPTDSILILLPSDVTGVRTSNAFFGGNRVMTGIETSGQALLTRTQLSKKGVQWLSTSTDPAELFQGVPARALAVTTSETHVAAFGIDPANAILLQAGTADEVALKSTTTLDLPIASPTTGLNTSYNDDRILVGYASASGNAVVAGLKWHRNHARVLLDVLFCNELDPSSTTPRLHLYANGTSKVAVQTTSGDLKVYDLDGTGDIFFSKTIDIDVSDYYLDANENTAVLAFKKANDLLFAQYDAEKTTWSDPILYLAGAQKPICLAQQAKTAFMGGRRTADNIHNMYHKTQSQSPILVWQSAYATATTPPFNWAITKISGAQTCQTAFSYVPLTEGIIITGVGSSYDPYTVLKETNSVLDPVK